MVKNTHGYTLVELFAVIIISTVIIVPLLTTLIGNIEINTRMHERRNATSIAEGAVYGFDKLDYDDLDSALDTAVLGGANFVEINVDQCVATFTLVADETLCTYLFNSITGNSTFDSTKFRVFVYEYDLTSGVLSDLTTDTNLPVKVRDEISLLSASTDGNPDLLRLTIWIQYNDDPVEVIVLSGVIINEQY